MFPSTNIVNATSMIAILLRNRETINRAYLVFMRQLDVAQSGEASWPDAALWGKMVQGVASIGRADPTNARYKWYQRAQELVERWNEVQAERLGEPAKSEVPMLNNDGVQIYSGYMIGLLQYVTRNPPRRS